MVAIVVIIIITILLFLALLLSMAPMILTLAHFVSQLASQIPKKKFHNFLLFLSGCLVGHVRRAEGCEGSK